MKHNIPSTEKQTSISSTTQDDYWIRFPDATKYNPRKVYKIQHNYSHHPLLELAELQKLAERYQAANSGLIKFAPKGVNNKSEFLLGTKHPDGLSVQEVFATIHEPSSWVALYDVQNDPIYKAFIYDIIGSMGSISDKTDPDTYLASGYIFISSPPTATPFHIDRENNYLLQIHGNKRVSVWDPADRETISEAAVEDWIVRSNLGRVKYNDSLLSKSVINEELNPGDGIYMPSTAAHMTNTELNSSRNEETYSITIGVVFYTKQTRRAANIYALNSTLRKLGINPTPPYLSGFYDQIRYPFARLFTKFFMSVKKIIRGHDCPPGF